MNEDGQITALLALLFLLMIGIGFLIFGGMREYFKASLVEEAFDAAGEDALAYYDRALQERYHIFLMDPREESYLISDASDGIQKMIDQNRFFSGISSEITMESKKTALDDNGTAVNTQIKEWETCQGIYHLPEKMNQLLKSTEKKESLSRELEEYCKKDSPASGDGEAEEESEEQKKAKSTWKEWKEVLGGILDRGILYYVIKDPSKISSLQLTSTSDLPSKTLGLKNTIFEMNGLSLTKISQLKNLYEKGVSEQKNSSLRTSQIHLMPYAFECFSHYGDHSSDKKHCLRYEIEYLIAGKTKDKENLKYVADQMFLLRFIVNYGYAVKNPKIRAETDSMALALTGVLGFPEGKEIVSQLLIASLCYGESLLEVKALFEGKKVALVKTEVNWNLTFANAAAKLKNRSSIRPVTTGVDYEEYLAGMLLMHCDGRKLLFRMMDLMQCNVALDETGFRMKNAIYSFKWSGRFSWNPWIRQMVSIGLQWKEPFVRTVTRMVTYQ